MGRLGPECLHFSTLWFSWAELTKQKKKKCFTKKGKGFRRKELHCSDDRGKMDLKDLVTYGREERGSREPGQSGRKQERERAPRDPVEKGIWER